MSNMNYSIEQASLTDVFCKIAETEIAETPASAVKCTYHFLQRFSERVARKSRRRWHFAEQAYLYGTSMEDVKNCHLRNYCESRQVSYGGQAKIYHGFIYFFQGNVAITVFQVPKYLRNCL